MTDLQSTPGGRTYLSVAKDVLGDEFDQEVKHLTYFKKNADGKGWTKIDNVEEPFDTSADFKIKKTVQYGKNKKWLIEKP